jgi:hypothetical protein
VTQLVAFTIPDDSAQLPAWLEARLVAPDFGRFVAELVAVYPERGRALPARQLMGDWYRKALADGLGGVPAGVLEQLLRHPKSLLELQEAVLSEGGAYWDEVATRADEMTATVERGRGALEAIVAQANPTREGEGGVARATPALAGGVRPERRRSYLTWALASSALAACLLVAVGYLTLVKKPDLGGTETAAVTWGWAKPGGIPQDAQKPAEYLIALAATSEEWFNKRPEDAAGVAKRINEFRTGCSQLIFSPHTPLEPADRDWLVERCRLWAKKLDEHLSALEAGADPLEVRKKADETINALRDKLRERAAQLG